MAAAKRKTMASNLRTEETPPTFPTIWRCRGSLHHGWGLTPVLVGGIGESVRVQGAAITENYSVYGGICGEGAHRGDGRVAALREGAGHSLSPNCALALRARLFVTPRWRSCLCFSRTLIPRSF
jgi:hypothetical protein